MYDINQQAMDSHIDEVNDVAKPDINLMPEGDANPIQQEERQQVQQDIMPGFNQNALVAGQNNLNNAGVMPDLQIAAADEVEENSDSDEELNDSLIDRLMSEAYDSDQEREDQKCREERFKRKNVSGAYVSRLIFRKAK